MDTQTLPTSDAMKPVIRDILGAVMHDKHTQIEAWFDKQYSTRTPFFYSSVDIRHAGYKIAPVDTNVFPAGFNLLTPTAVARAIEVVTAWKQRTGASRIVLVPENHTRNTHYLQNIYALQQILLQSGLEVVIGGLEVDEQITLETAEGQALTLHPLVREGDTLAVKGCGKPFDVVLVNNDLSSGAPEILQGLAQPVFPPLGMGWYRRRKTQHFESYTDVAREFCQQFSIDPWLISTLFTECGSINFKEKSGLECVANNVDKTLFSIEKKYQEYGIEEQPYVFIKADSGTYGMGIMTVRSGEEALEINKKIRNKMNAIKEGVTNSQVIIQEGVPTVDVVDGHPAEPMVYLMHGEALGCNYRVNSDKDAYGNLNARGMTFSAILSNERDTDDKPTDQCPVQSLIARLAALAAVRECD